MTSSIVTIFTNQSATVLDNAECDRSLPIATPTLNTLITELGSECHQVTALIYQLQSPHLSARQQAEILAELLAAAIHLNAHCGEDLLLR